MAPRESGHSPIRLLALFGVLILLGIPLGWQWRNFNWRGVADKLKLPEPPSRKISATPTAAVLEQLNQARLDFIQTKSTEIDALVKDRRNSGFQPALGVPIMVAASTRDKFRTDQLKFRLRELEDYRRLTVDPPDARSAGERFLEAYFRQVVNREIKSPDFDELEKLGRAALDAGSQDPLLQTYHGFAHWTQTGEIEFAIQALTDSIRKLPQTRYSGYVEAYARHFLYDIAKTAPFDGRLAEFRKLTLKPVFEWLVQEGSSDEWREAIYERVLNQWKVASEAERETFLSDCLKSDQVDKYIVQVLLGSHYIQLAWRHRGSGYADTVTAEMWQQFRLHARCAASHLRYAWFLHPELPYAPCELIDLGKAGETEGEEAHFWFLRAIEARFDYYGAYSSFISALLPRWGGSHDQMLAFAGNCIGTDRFDTTVPYVALDVLTSLRDSEQEDLSIHAGAKQLLRDLTTRRNTYRERHPNDRLYEDNGAYRADLVKLAEDCRMPELAAAEYRLAGDNINWTRLRDHHRPGRYLAARLMAAEGPAGRNVLVFDEKLRQPWSSESDAAVLDELILEFRQLKDKLPEGDAGGPFFAHAEIVLGQLRQFSSGEWTDLQIGKQLEGWEPYCDRWWIQDDGCVELSCGAESREINLRPLANFHPPLEIEATLEMVDPAPYPNPAGIGWCPEREPAPGVRVSSHPKFAIEARKMTPRGGPAFRRDSLHSTAGSEYASRVFLSHAGPHRIRLRLWKDAADLVVDDAAWFSTALFEAWNPDSFLCFGTNPISHVRGNLRLSKIRVRKLTELAPPAASEPLDLHAKYWEERRARTSDFEPLVLGQLCRFRYEQGRFDDVLSLVDLALEKYPGLNQATIWKARAMIARRGDIAGAYAILRDDRMLNDSDDPEGLAILAEIRAMADDGEIRNGMLALSTARLAVQLGGKTHARALAAQAAAHAEIGDFPGAINEIKRALEGANVWEKVEWEKRLEAYLSNKPYRYQQ